MSDSDSEADFESADEDTEHDTSDKSSISNSVAEDSTARLPQTFETDLKSAPHFPNKSDRIQEIKSQQLPQDDINTFISSESKQLENASADGDSKTLESSETKQLQDASVDDNSKIIDSSISNKSKIASTDQVEKQTDRKNVTQERVTLRLEKKLQQKSRELAKENSTEKEKSSPDKKNEPEVEEIKSGWGFGSWGTSLLSTAASSVSTFTNQVSQGIGTVLETVENSLGAPPPEELASVLNERKASSDSAETDGKEVEKDDKTPDEETETSGNSILTGVSSWTKALENTGAKVLMGGLDTLELIGKKTIDILTEGDPGLRKKRAVFNQDNTLSQILREAKTKADEQRESESENSEEIVHYSQHFDEYQGLIHLEALEILSSQSQAKVQRLMTRLSSKDNLLELLDEIRIICQNLPPLDDTPDEEKQQNFDELFLQHIHALNLPVSTDKLLESQKRISDYLAQCIDQSPDEMRRAEEIYPEAINSLAEFTAKCMEQFHRVAELILVQSTLEPGALQCAGYLTGLTTVLCVEICIMSARFSFCLQSAGKNCPDRASVNPMITSVYLEASNSTTYIQDAYQLFIPVLQLSLLESLV